MNTKIGTSFGLALLLVVGVVATMLALGMFSPQKANAAAPVVTALTGAPGDPGDAASIKITFTTDETIQGNSGEIWVRFDKNYTVPATIAKELITITTVQTTGGTSNPLIDPTVQTVSSTTDAALLNDTLVKITLGDTVSSSTTTVEDMHAAAGHIITFASTAGILLPTSSSEDDNIVRMSIDSGTTYGAGDLNIDTARVLTLNAVTGPKGTVVTATGKGFSSTGTASIWIDDGDGTNGTADDGIINGTERVVAKDIVVTAGAFTQDFTTDDYFGVTANQINAVDGGGTAVATASNPTFTTTGGVTLAKTTIARGETIKITLAQYTDGTITAVKFGGVPANLGSLAAGSVTIASNAGTLTVTVPTTTPLGTQQVVVSSTGESDRTGTVAVTTDWADVELTPSLTTVVPSQDITVTATGFTKSSTVSTITVGGSDVPTLTSASAVTTVATDNSGNLVATFPIPNDATTRVAADYEIKITDAGGKIGVVDITIPARVLTLDIASSKRNSTVAASGTGYVSESTITLDYEGTTVATVAADSAGAFSTTFSVPATALIPSTNTVTATSGGGGADTETHKVPGSSITIDPVEAVSGDSITVTGVDFPGYAAVTIMDVGGLAAIISPAPSTDVDGGFSASIMVPQLALGTHSVLIKAGGISANTSITVIAAPAVVAATTNATEDVFADVIAADALVRVWQYNNATQLWSFYDPRDAFTASNDYTDASSNDIVWVNVSSQQEFQDQTLYEGWNLISLD
jgi:hypothetical protein